MTGFKVKYTLLLFCITFAISVFELEGLLNIGIGKAEAFVVSVSAPKVPDPFENFTNYLEQNKLRNTTTELAKFCGTDCTAEKILVVTNDGYILSLFHLKCSSKQVTKCPVLLMPGILLSSDCFFLKAGDSLACKLAEEGYDVYIGNYRGNRYGLNHITLSSSTPAFWKFSIDEMGKFDVPAMIDRVVNEAGGCKIFYVGYSMGGTMSLIFAFRHPEQLNKLKALILVSPGYKHCGATAPIAFIPSPVIAGVAKMTGGPLVPEVFLQLVYPSASQACPWDPVNAICPFVYGTPGGYLQTSKEITKLASQYLPDITGAYPLQEILQNKEQCKFQSLDTNPLYPLPMGSTAVQYDISSIPYSGIPVLVLYGLNDTLIPPKNIADLCKKLTGSQCKGYDGTAHLDMIIGNQVHNTVYPDLIDFLDERCTSHACSPGN